MDVIAPVLGLNVITDRRLVEARTSSPSSIISWAVRLIPAGRLTATPCAKDPLNCVTEEFAVKLKVSDCGPVKTLSTTLTLRNVIFSVRFGACASMAVRRFGRLPMFLAGSGNGGGVPVWARNERICVGPNGLRLLALRNP